MPLTWVQPEDVLSAPLAQKSVLVGDGISGQGHHTEEKFDQRHYAGRIKNRKLRIQRQWKPQTGETHICEAQTVASSGHLNLTIHLGHNSIVLKVLNYKRKLKSWPCLTCLSLSLIHSKYATN